MSISARTPTTVVTNLYVPVIYTNQVIEAAKSKIVIMDTVNNEWISGYTKGYVFYLPKTNTVTPTEVVVGTKGTALNPFNTTGVTVTINQWYEAPIDVDYMTRDQSQVDLGPFAAREAAAGIKKTVDTYIGSLFSSGTSAGNTDGTALTDDLLLAMGETLNSADVDLDEGRTLMLDPSGMTDMMKFDKFIASIYVATGAVSNGIIGKSPIYGCTVRMSNNLTAATTGAYGCMYHKNFIASKIQIQNSWKKEFEELHQTRYHSEALWGASVAQATFGVYFYTRAK